MADPFPSLIIRPDSLAAQGSFAEAQAEFLQPDPASVDELTRLLESHNVGVVAHFYMDPELQGVLSASRWPHIQISDSLLMADAAVRMAEAGVEKIVVLGVDFMSENVRAMLDHAGFADVPVYRVAAEPIGCSLAESAQAPAYGAFLDKAAKTPSSLHVIYINTGLDVKAHSHHKVPTITCTSSNVVKTILQAAAQVPNLTVWYGPDTYMGANLAHLFANLADMDDDAVRDLHPQHTAASVRDLLDRFQYFRQGTCIVHHMFGHEVVQTTRDHYGDVFITAHPEVPGEMSDLALAAPHQGNGVVGSTANILGFIADKVAEQAPEQGGRLRFILGTEAGMITSVVRKVQALLRERQQAGGSPLEAEIIFPVASEAVATTDDTELGVVPGVAGGEGCSTAGGCATCPYMKMNSLDALVDLLNRLDTAAEAELTPFFPRTYVARLDGRSLAQIGSEPILHMRHFQKTGEMSPELVADIIGRTAKSSA